MIKFRANICSFVNNHGVVVLELCAIWQLAVPYNILLGYLVSLDRSMRRTSLIGAHHLLNNALTGWL
jgi:hypothetical protein